MVLFFQPTGNNIGDTGATQLSEALKSNTTLTKLDLCGEYKRNKHTKASINKSLFAFLFTSTESKIGDTGVTSLSKALKSNTTLDELILRSRDKKKEDTQKTSISKSSFSIQSTTTACYIKERGAISLSESLKSNTTLIALDLSRENTRNTCK